MIKLHQNKEMELAYILNTITLFDNTSISEEYPVQYQNIISIHPDSTIRDVYDQVLRDILDNRVCNDLRSGYTFQVSAKYHPVDYQDVQIPLLLGGAFLPWDLRVVGSAIEPTMFLSCQWIQIQTDRSDDDSDDE